MAKVHEKSSTFSGRVEKKEDRIVAGKRKAIKFMSTDSLAPYNWVEN